MPLLKRIIYLSLPVFFFLSETVNLYSQPVTHPRAREVVVVANKNMEGSINVAQFYMRQRGIPKKNLILLETSTEESISREVYLKEIANPIVRELIQNEWINAVADSEDSLGRLKPIVFKKNINYLVLCYGVPLKISEIADLDDILISKQFFGKDQPIQFDTGPLAVNRASVDGELATLFLTNPPLNGFIPNPYHNKSKYTKSDVLKVMRLDGPSARSVKNLIRQTLKGEKKGLRGRAYVDEDKRDGGYAEGNNWLKAVAETFKNLNYPLNHNTDQRTFDERDRFDTPVLYAGWYRKDIHAPFTYPDFKFPPGAIAVHLHSSSANPLRINNKRWTGPFVAKGVSATVGNTSEPYLTLTHNLDILFKALSEGNNFGDAAYMALPGISWQGISLGDPLFTPFGKSLDDQLKDAGNPLESFLDQYVFIRKMQESKDPETIALRGMLRSPGPALAYEKALTLAKKGNTIGAAKAIRLFKTNPPSSSSDWVLYQYMADLAIELKEPRLAYALYFNLLNQKNISLKLKKRWLSTAAQTARKINEFQQALNWEAELKKLNTPSPPKEGFPKN